MSRITRILLPCPRSLILHSQLLEVQHYMPEDGKRFRVAVPNPLNANRSEKESEHVFLGRLIYVETNDKMTDPKVYLIIIGRLSVFNQRGIPNNLLLSKIRFKSRSSRYPETFYLVGVNLSPCLGPSLYERWLISCSVKWPSVALKTDVDQIIKSRCITLAILAQENAFLRQANEKGAETYMV